MMKLFLAALIGCATLALGPGRAAAADCGAAITADEALKAEDARYAAQTSGDFAAMDKLFGDELVYIHSTGHVDGKASYIEAQRSKAVVYRAMARSNATVRVYGCVAIITANGHFAVTVGGKDREVDLLFHSIWAKRDAGLQFVSWESTTAPAKP